MVLSFLDYFAGVLGFIKSREKGVGVGNGGVDFGEIKSGDVGEECFVDAAAADDENFFVGVLMVLDELFHIMDDEVWSVEIT